MTEPFDSFLQENGKSRPILIVKEDALAITPPKDNWCSAPGA
jgi:hypothetical protein